MSARGAVAWLHPTLRFGGAQRVLVEQVRALAPRGGSVDVFAVGPRGGDDVAAALRDAHPGLRDVGHLATSRDVLATLRSRRYDAVWTCWTSKAYRAVERLRRRPFAKAPVVVETVHERYRGAMRDHEGRRRDQVDFWMATYDFRASLARAFGAGDDRVGVARPLFPSLLPADPEGAARAGRALRRALGVAEGALVVGYAGRFSPAKGLHLLVPLVARLAARGRDVHLVLAGAVSPPAPAYEAALLAEVERARAPSAPLAGRLHVLPSPADARDVLAASDVVALLSSVEGLLPLMLVEALGRGVAVVTTDVGGIRGCLDDGVHAAVVEKAPDDEGEPTPEVVAAFEARLDALLGDPALRARLAAAGRARVEALVAGNDFHGDTLAGFERALARGRR